MSDFKNNIIGMTEIQKEIHHTVASIVNNYYKLPKEEKNARWFTKEVKLGLGELGAKYGFNSYSTEHVAEWLYDYVWYTQDEHGHISSVEMCLESEVSGRSQAHLKDDFEKLKVANAPLKVFICHAEGNFSHPENVNNVITFLEESAAALKNRNLHDSTLVLIWEDFNSGDIIPHLI